MTDDNITTLDSSSNFMLEHTMEEFNNDTNERESSFKKNQFQRTIDILSIDINNIPLDNETKHINNLIGLPIEDKHSIDRTSEGNNTISELNLAKKIEKGDSTHQFVQVKDTSNNNICLSETNSPVGNSFVKLQTNSISNNYPFIKKVFSEKDLFGKDKMNQTDLTFHVDKKTIKNESLTTSSELKKNVDLPISSLSFFLPNDPQSSSFSNDDEFDFEYQIVEDGSISSSLESIDSYKKSNLVQQSLKTNNNTLAKSTVDENVSYYNLPDKKLSNANNLNLTYPSSKNFTKTKNVTGKKAIIEKERDQLSPTSILPPPSYKEACRFLSSRGEEVVKKRLIPQFEKNNLIRRSSLLRQNSIRYKKGDPRSPLFLSKQSRSLSREGISKFFEEEEDIQDLNKTVHTGSLKSFNRIGGNNLSEEYKTSKRTISTPTLENKDCSQKSLDNIYKDLLGSFKSVDSITSNCLSKNTTTMETNVLNHLREGNLILEDRNSISLNDETTSLLNSEILSDSKEENFDLQDLVDSKPTLYGPSFSLSRISENTDSVEEPVDAAPKFHTLREVSSGRRSSLSIFGVSSHRRGRSEDSTFLTRDNADILSFDNDSEVFLTNNPLESVENVAIRDRSKNNRDSAGSTRESKCKSQFLVLGNYGIESLSKSKAELNDFKTLKDGEIGSTNELETSCDDSSSIQTFPSSSAPSSSKNSKKEKNSSKKSNNNPPSLENKLSKKYESLKEFNLTEKDKDLEDNYKINKIKKTSSTKSTKFRLVSSISKGKSNDKGSKGILGSLFGGKKKNSKPSLQVIFPNSGLGSKTISEATFASINQSCNLIVGDQKKSSTLPIDAMKTENKISFTNTDPIMGLPDDIRTALNPHNQSNIPTPKNTFSFSETHKIPSDSMSIHSSISNKHYNVELIKISEWAEYYNWDPQNQELYKHPDFKRLSRTEKEKQNTIRELVGTEKNYCEVLLLLRQCFNYNLREESIFVNDGDVNLVPQPATDNLIKFHMSFLSSLKSRLEESIIVTEISDIILEYFGNQNNLSVVYGSYTELCSGSDEMKRLYDVTYSKNTKFSNYCNKLNKDVSFKGRDYKSCLGILSQRCTKYPMLLERIAKSEKNKDLHGKASAAFETMKLFTTTIDSNLNKYQINKLWDSFKQMIDKNSYGLYCGKAFTLQDLIYQAPCNSRKIVCISRADYFRQSRKGREEKSILLLALFDDILVFFVVKNNIAYFFNLDNHQAVFSIKHTSTRPIERQSKLVIMHLNKKNTDMIILRFNDKEKMQDFELALRETKSKIKNLSDDEEEECELSYTPRKQDIISKNNIHFAPIEDTFGLDAKTFEKYNMWWSEMETIFDNRKTEDLMITKYVQDRMAWYKQLKAHIASMPFAKNKQIPSKTIKAIYDKFDELDRIRVFDNSEYIECLKKLERDDCKDLFDAWNGIFCKSDSEDSDSDSKKKSCVKRVSTYAGQQNKFNTKVISSTYRRHTTVPNLSSDNVVLSPTKEDLSNFALIKGDNSRRAAEKLLKENIDLRSEVVRLRSDVTLMATQVASLKGCKNIDSYSNSSKLEELREKQMELVEREKKNKEQFEAREKELAEREKLLLERETKCEMTEKDLLTKWQAYYKHKVNPTSGGTSTSLMHDSEMPSTPILENPYNLPHAGCYSEGISKVISNSKENSFLFSPTEQSTRSNGLPIKSKSHSSIHSDNRQVNALPVHLASKSETSKNKKK